MIGISSVINKIKLFNIHNKRIKRLADLSDKLLNQNLINSDTFKIDTLKAQLRNSQVAEQHIQEGVSFLQEKNKAVNSLKDMAKELKQLSLKYNNVDCSENDKQDIEKQTQEIIDNMNSILNTTFGNKSVFQQGQISVETSHGSNIIINTKSFDISIDSDANKKSKHDNGTGMHIEGDLSIKDILQNSNRIENNLIKPLDKYSDGVRKQMVGLVNDAMYQDMIVTMSAKKLVSLKVIDGYIASAIIKASNVILENANKALYSQSSNLDSSDVMKLIS